MSLSFSIEALMVKRGKTGAEEVKVEATTSSEEDRMEEEEEERAGESPRGGQSGSWQDVLLPHLQMASSNPFLVGLSAFHQPPPFGLVMEAGKKFPPTSPDLHPLNPFAGQRSAWTPQWLELLQQAGGAARFFPGAGDAGLFIHPYRKPKRIRTAFSPTQLLQLEDAFKQDHYVVGAQRKQLAHKLQLTETQVKVWFQNRRTKHKRLKSEDEVKCCSAETTPKPSTSPRDFLPHSPSSA